ncbi:hypothetical protein SJAG_04804 [Schizosaccharomyces japonicus yFS275]|uniref:Uncharacterized protein n=1 Tax=Schizosaccharomyces japonicus (strain yFS275 / FY16936) TaxID=402676 RepID=B6K7T4_SCHJY|nr:hypothetical protein SJAG_04804 [Schizosaccharomyces japonicus yFS275]EEB09588.1 hypothetical protein SJAG_04804 [Schizosaccharomyces japonicus yFS275]
MKHKTYPPIAEGFSNNNTVFVFENTHGNGPACQQVGLYGYNASITFTAKCTNDGAFSYLVYDMFGVDYTSNITTDRGTSTGFGEFVVLNNSYGRIYSNGIYSPTLNDSLTKWTVNLPGAGNYCTNIMPLRYKEDYIDCDVKIRFDGVTPPENTLSSAFRVTPLLLPVVVSVFLTVLFAY